MRGLSISAMDKTTRKAPGDEPAEVNSPLFIMMIS
jgi:hypothetical protein